MKQLPRILLQVHLVYADLFRLPVHMYLHIAVSPCGVKILRDLVPLGQISIVIILAVKGDLLRHTAVERHRRFYGILQRFFIQFGQRPPGQPQAERAHLAIGFGAKGGTAAAKQLCTCQKFHVYFQSDYSFKFRQQLHPLE